MQGGRFRVFHYFKESILVYGPGIFLSFFNRPVQALQHGRRFEFFGDHKQTCSTKSLSQIPPTAPGRHWHCQQKTGENRSEPPKQLGNGEEQQTGPDNPKERRPPMPTERFNESSFGVAAILGIPAGIFAHKGADDKTGLQESEIGRKQDRTECFRHYAQSKHESAAKTHNPLTS